MQKYSKISLIYFVSIVLITIIYATIAIYLHDPLQIWHKPFFRKQITYSNTIRESARAMINNEQFDSIIIGNSHTENTSCKVAEKLFGGKFINLSISGSTLYEKNLILSYLLKRKKVKKVVYLVDENYATLSLEPLLFDTKQYSFIYNDNPFDDFKIYLNNKYLFRTLIFSQSKKCIGNIKNMDKPYAWETVSSHIKRFGGFDNWVKNKKNGQIKGYFNTILKTPLEYNNQHLSEEYKKDLHDYLDKYLFTNIAQAPETDFYIIISPVSDIELARRIRSYDPIFAKQCELLGYLVIKKNEYKNFKIYAFNDKPNLSSLEDYKDGTHYRPWINHYILEAIKNNENEINSENVQEYIDKVYNLAKQFDYEYYYNQIKKVVDKV